MSTFSNCILRKWSICFNL